MSKDDEHTDEVVADLVAAIRQTREDKKVSMNRLAWMSGVSVKAIDFIEKGQNSPTLRTLLKLCQALEINLSDYLKKSEQEHGIRFK